VLNPISRALFALGALALFFAARAWFKVSQAEDGRVISRTRDAALPTAAAAFAFALAVLAMMAWGPWDRPYKWNAAFEAAFQQTEDADR
jgi:hypothetical protein